MRKYIFLFATLLLVSGISLLFIKPIFSAKSSDAIAVRVVPNPSHHNALRWYESQGFKGAPQSVIVDGYEGIRDGRSVYVNAANIVNRNGVEILYTYIYVISYNQGAEKPTIDILGQILEHWKFNRERNVSGTCSNDANRHCLIDDDCLVSGKSGFCSSEKANIVRDTRRLADLAEIKIYLEQYKAKYGKYPTLNAGSYLPNKTISVWPSWQATLGKELSVKMPIDPINKLGDCGGSQYNPITCWDNEAKTFAGDLNNTNSIVLPENSSVYVLSFSANGLSYGACAITESPFVQEGTGGGCGGTSSNWQGSGDVVANTSPTLSHGSTIIRLLSGQELKYYVRSSDLQSNMTPASWNITFTNEASYAGGLWTAAPVLKAVPTMPNARQVYAAKVGKQGDYYFTVTITDANGGTASSNFTVRVTNPNPVIKGGDSAQVEVADATNEKNNNYPFTLQISDSNNNMPIKYELDGGLPNGMATSSSNTSYQIYGAPLVSTPENTDYHFTLTAIDCYDGRSSKEFTIKITNDPPVITMPQ